jgi:hypothetical protein
MLASQREIITNKQTMLKGGDCTLAKLATDAADIVVLHLC